MGDCPKSPVEENRAFAPLFPRKLVLGNVDIAPLISLAFF